MKNNKIHFISSRLISDQSAQALLSAPWLHLLTHGVERLFALPFVCPPTANQGTAADVLHKAALLSPSLSSAG